MGVNFKIWTSLKRGIDSSSLPLDDRSHVSLRRRLTISVGRGASISSPCADVARAGIGALEVSDGDLECTNVSKRSSYKGLFLVCLMDL